MDKYKYKYRVWMILGFRFLFMMTGCLTVVIFNYGVLFPIWLSVSLLVTVSLFLLASYKNKWVGALLVFLWLIYVLPFIHMIPYLWFDFEQESPALLWGLVVNPYMVDEQVVSLTAMIGAVGGLGFAFGIACHTRRVKVDIKTVDFIRHGRIRTLSMSVWLVWVFGGVALSWLAAPQDTLFGASYTSSESALTGANFGSAWMISYIMLIFALCDALLERNLKKRALKGWVIVCTIAFVVIFLQLLRGDRESITLVFAALLAYQYWAAPLTGRTDTKLPWARIAAGGFMLVAVSMFLKVTRHRLVEIQDIDSFLSLVAGLSDAGLLSVSNLLNGTWSAVLLTPLSVAGDHIYRSSELLFGKDYLNIFLSIPPGFVADALGYVRPIDSSSGPAWRMRYGLGGTHATVLPFINFGMLGVLVVPSLWAYIFTHYEKRAMRTLSVSNLALLCTILMVAPHWLWYGEKYVLNAIIIWLLFVFLYRVSLSSRSPSKVKRAVLT